MLQPWIVVVSAVAYLGLLFAIAWWGDRRADQGRSVIARPSIYALSLAVYCTSWTFYGSVGRAAGSGLGFLPIYIGPTLVALLWPVLLRKMIRISQAHRITSIADFIATRYGRSQLLGGMVTIIAVIGIAPYIGLQLKAVSTTSALMFNYPDIHVQTGAAPLWRDSAFYIAMALAAFTILFGTRHLDASERHEGMVAAIAFESVVKLFAFLAVGIFVTYGLYDGFGDVFERAAAHPELSRLMSMESVGGYGSWISLTFLAALAILFLPRQFQVAVVENQDERHIERAVWMFPAYLLLINLFVLPIAFGGLLHFQGQGVNADTFVLSLPMVEHRQGLALLVFIGGLSAATGMVIVETIALSTMVSNDLVMPLLFRVKRLRLQQRKDLSGLLLRIRRGAIILVLLLGYLYFRAAGETPSLVSIGLISFAAVAQFAPAMFAAMFWRAANRRGALAGLGAGFAVWAFTLLVPAITRAGGLPAEILSEGLFGLAWLKPTALFGLAGMSEISQGLFWSLLSNVVGLVLFSLRTEPTVNESTQARLFVDVLQRDPGAAPTRLWRGSATVADLEEVLGRFLGPHKAAQELDRYARGLELGSRTELVADSELVQRAERLLAGAIGGASARVMIASVVKEEQLTMDEVLEILDETSQVIVYSRKLERASEELRQANERLTELDRLKDEFVSTISHELRTPLTSIRAFSEILRDNPEIQAEQRQQYLGIVVSESERLSRLINQVLDLSKLEADRFEWHDGWVAPREVIDGAIAGIRQLADDQGTRIETNIRPTGKLLVDADRLTQVVVNLLSNAVKFCASEGGLVVVGLREQQGMIEIAIEDNGPGVPEADRTQVFEKFRQSGDTLTDKPQGTGLGLPISLQIVRHYDGDISVESSPHGGARFRVTLPSGERNPSQDNE